MATLKKSNREIEDRYAEEDRDVSQERNDFLLPQIIDFIHHKKWMNLQPEYQRRQVWEKKKQSLFIESLLMNLPIPPVFLFEPEYSRYEVMDGQQRLSSIVAFYSNRLKLTGLEHWTELNGRIYSDLPVKLQRGLDRRRISAVVLQSASPSSNGEELRRIVFERLNTGGQKLNAQELRNCVYAGQFASLLVKLAGFRPFNDLWEIPPYDDNMTSGHASNELAANPLFKRMIDCELVLRFFAFRNKKYIKGSVKSILDNCMNRNQNADDVSLTEMENDFMSRIILAHSILGKGAFKIDDGNGAMKNSQPFYDAVMVACDRQFNNRRSLIRNKAIIKKEIGRAFKIETNYELIVGRANTAEAIKRLDLVEECFKCAP